MKISLFILLIQLDVAVALWPWQQACRIPPVPHGQDQARRISEG
ncbi:hypothetical protein [Marinobacter sp. F3R08]|nr:hypothetical protein [Marinobacter sp. F3R08]